MKKVLVTGSSGFIGGYIVEELLSQNYQVIGLDNLSKYDEDSLLVMSSNHPQTVNVKQFPMCYVAANDKTFKRIFNVEDSWQEFITKIQNNGWYTDQLYLYDKIKNSVGYDIILMERDDSYTLRRIDRGSWSYEEVKLKNGYYIDCHSLRPVSSHQKEINKLINILLDE